MVDYRARRRMPPHGRADAAVVAAMRKAIGEAADDSTRTTAFVFRRTREIIAGDGDAGKPPSERTLYRLFGRLEAGRHTTGSARTRRSLAARPEGPFGRVPAAAPGDVMQIDSTPLDVLVRLDDGVIGRVDLTGIIDVATRTVTAAVLRPTTKSVDASVLLARTVTPEPMRPGWPQAMRMSESALPFRRMLSIDERLEHAAARPVIIPQVITVDHGKVFVSESFKASCAFLGISFQPARKATGTDKPHIEKMLGSVATMFAQYVSGYTGRSPEYRGRGTEEKAVWSLPELQDLLDQWLITTRGRPVRAVTACRLCTAARRISHLVPVHIPAHHQVCLTHGIWLPGPGTPQFNVSGCPDILAAEHQARRLLRRRTIEQLSYARLQATPGNADHEWKRRMAALIKSNPRQATESGPQALFQAAAYPEAIAAAAAALTLARPVATADGA